MNKRDDTLQYERPVILVGPADFDNDLFQKLAGHNYAIIAADGGANRLYDLNIMPDAIIGDLDSLENRDSFGTDTKIIHFQEQQTTDFEKCLNCVDAPIFLAMGFTGKRLDHTLANLHTITKFRETKKLLLITNDDVSFVWQGPFTSAVAKHMTVSVFPLMPIQFSYSKGLLFELDHLDMELGQFVGTSNHTTDNNFSIVPASSHSVTPYLITLSGSDLHELVKIGLRNASGKTN